MKFYIFILLVCLINSCADDRTQDMLLSSNYIGTSDSFDIITWNIEWFPKNIKSIDYIAEAIIELDVDILGLQEITSTSKFNLLISKINIPYNMKLLMQELMSVGLKLKLELDQNRYNYGS